MMCTIERQSRPLLILDLDETLLYATADRLDRPPCFAFEKYAVYLRPFARQFLAGCVELFDIAVWSSASTDYVAAMVSELFRCPTALRFVWARPRCTLRYDGEAMTRYWVKDLKKVRRKGIPLSRVIIVDDEPRKCERNYGNAVYVRSFTGDPADRELLHLAEYLETLATVADVRRVEKRGWRSKVLRNREKHE